MSTLESIIWHVLGYSAIPLIVIAGIVGSILIYQLFVKLSGAGDDD
jgi:uncharacterized protein (TIGR02808 family)